MQGLHLTADLYDCRCDPALLTDAAQFAALCRRAIEGSALTLVDEKYVRFPDHDGHPGGITGALLLAESHLAIHSWPERRSVTLDVYVCNFSTNNSTKAERALEILLEAFDPGSRVIERLLRGIDDPFAQAAGPGAAFDRPGAGLADPAPQPAGSPAPGLLHRLAESDDTDGSGTDVGEPGHGLLLEWLNTDSAYGFRASRRIESVRTRWQKLEVFDTPQWGRLFRLDGCFMTSERDEFFYHEPLVHPAAITHPEPRSALVIGGGDGGSTEELLKHPSMQRVVVAELDAEVIRMARAHLAGVHHGALDDPRVEIRIGDGWDCTAAMVAAGDRFDLVILDLTDPETPAHHLYSRDYFALARQVLCERGALALHIGSPVYRPDRVRSLLADLHSVFRLVRPLGVHVPLYGAYWGMAVASDHLDPLAIDTAEAARRIGARRLADLRYYNEQVHSGLFALPNFFRALQP